MTKSLDSHASRNDTPRPKLNGFINHAAKKAKEKTEKFSKEFTEYLAKAPISGDLGDRCECHCCCWWWK